jgi:hypothetical protein
MSVAVNGRSGSLNCGRHRVDDGPENSPSVRAARRAAAQASAVDTAVTSSMSSGAEKASELPVLPPVYSTTGWPARSRPARSAPSIMARAIRSL